MYFNILFTKWLVLIYSLFIEFSFVNIKQDPLMDCARERNLDAWFDVCCATNVFCYHLMIESRAGPLLAWHCFSQEQILHI